MLIEELHKFSDNFIINYCFRCAQTEDAARNQRGRGVQTGRILGISIDIDPGCQQLQLLDPQTCIVRHCTIVAAVAVAKSQKLLPFLSLMLASMTQLRLHKYTHTQTHMYLIDHIGVNQFRKNPSFGFRSPLCSRRCCCSSMVKPNLQGRTVAGRTQLKHSTVSSLYGINSINYINYLNNKHTHTHTRALTTQLTAKNVCLILQLVFEKFANFAYQILFLFVFKLAHTVSSFVIFFIYI